MKVLMIPQLSEFEKSESGIRRVVESYYKYLPQFGAELVGRDSAYDIKAVHAGITGQDCDVAHLHGIYFTADYKASHHEYRANANIVKALRAAKVTTVPLDWVAEIMQRDMHLNVISVPHGIEIEEWTHNEEVSNYVLWNKNRSGSDVCNADHVGLLAVRAKSIPFISTFAPRGYSSNVNVIGLQPHKTMKRLIQRSAVYLSTTKETFGIGTLEAMASGTPVLGFRHGGNIALVQHEVNGYLAKPWDYDDLAYGLEYCLRNRKQLGENGRELAKEWTWEKAVEKLYQVYLLAMQSDIEPSVSVVIPLYNYADKVGRTIKSVLQQKMSPKEIIIVDDGSSDNPEPVIKKLQKSHKNITFVKQSNSGVAIARNHGIRLATSKYVCCLDSDDAIEPDFLSVCVNALERDNSLSLAYTALRWIKPDGSSGVSQWPGKYNFDEQLKGRNQVPTCCVFTKDMWKRLGGYRQRYAPGGAGCEDAELWLRAGARGFKAEQVTKSPLFVYSWLSGRVSGSRNYREINWRTWHPWTRQDNVHPFASLATPKNKISHPVRQYDEPVISVIIPVGPGHEKEIVNGIDSLEAQSFQKWEVIVVWDSDKDIPQSIKDQFPFIRFIKSKSPRSGPGICRNAGVKIARADLILFLDADDWLYPNALETMFNEWESENAIIYSDYVGKSYIAKEDLPGMKMEVLFYNERTTETILRHKAADYHCNKAQRQPDIEGRNLYHWCLVTCLIPKAWHNEIGGFDEKMPSWEDVDYHWRMARAGKCYTHIEEPLIVYRFATGTRRELAITNNDLAQQLILYMSEKYKGIKNMGCKNCGKKRAVSPFPKMDTRIKKESKEMFDDTDYTHCKYTHPNRGDHSVVGGATHTEYGYHCGGDTFLVHKNDIALSPHLFNPIERVKKEPLLPIQPILESDFVNISASTASIEEIISKIEKAKDQDLDMEQENDILSLPYILPKVEKQLRDMKINTVEQVYELGYNGIIELKGIGEKRAKVICQAAKDYVEANK